MNTPETKPEKLCFEEKRCLKKNQNVNFRIQNTIAKKEKEKIGKENFLFNKDRMANCDQCFPNRNQNKSQIKPQKESVIFKNIIELPTETETKEQNPISLKKKKKSYKLPSKTEPEEQNSRGEKAH